MTGNADDAGAGKVCLEAQRRSTRGHGAFDPARDPLPDPAVVRVLAWLNGLL